MNQSSSPASISSAQPTLEEVRTRFQNDRFATESGAIIDEIRDGYAQCSMPILPCHRNAAGAIMGGAIFTLADFAFAVAANWNKPLHVSLSSQITYLSSAKGTTLIAQAQCIKSGHSTCYYEINVRDDRDRLIAHITTTGFRV